MTKESMTLDDFDAAIEAAFDEMVVDIERSIRESHISIGEIDERASENEIDEGKTELLIQLAFYRARNKIHSALDTFISE